MMRMAYDAYLKEASSVGSPGVDEWRFLAPVRPGDELRGRVTVLEARPSSSRPELGIVKNRWQLMNQRDELVVSLIGTQFYLRRQP
jgi:acyl dehydratase